MREIIRTQDQTLAFGQNKQALPQHNQTTQTSGNSHHLELVERPHDRCKHRHTIIQGPLHKDSFRIKSEASWLDINMDKANWSRAAIFHKHHHRTITSDFDNYAHSVLAIDHLVKQALLHLETA